MGPALQFLCANKDFAPQSYFFSKVDEVQSTLSGFHPQHSWGLNILSSFHLITVRAKNPVTCLQKVGLLAGKSAHIASTAAVTFASPLSSFAVCMQLLHPPGYVGGTEQLLHICRVI
jgi:hypothetical protein